MQALEGRHHAALVEIHVTLSVQLAAACSLNMKARTRRMRTSPVKRVSPCTILIVSLAAGLLLSLCCEGAAGPQTVSLEQAEGIILSTVLSGSDSGKVVCELPTQMKAGTVVHPSISAQSVSYAAPTDSWFFFIDDNPGYRWTHPCRYAFVCCYTGTQTVHNEGSPPDNADSLRVVIFK